MSRNRGRSVACRADCCRVSSALPPSLAKGGSHTIRSRHQEARPDKLGKRHHRLLCALQLCLSAPEIPCASSTPTVARLAAVPLRENGIILLTCIVGGRLIYMNGLLIWVLGQ